MPSKVKKEKKPLSTLAQACDAQLQILRAAIRSIVDDEAKSDTSYQRYQLFDALQRQDRAAALEWLSALRVALGLSDDNWGLYTKDKVRDALDKISTVVKEGK